MLATARSAFGERRWTDAFAHFSAADAGRPLDIDDLERCAAAAQLIGEDGASEAMWERAHLQLLEAGAVAKAVRCAFWLAFGLLNRGQMAQAGGWIGRAQRLVDEHGLDCPERGFLLVPMALRTLEGGDPSAARDMFERVLDFGQRFGEKDLVALGRLGQGRCLVVMGRDAEGLALLDEAMVSVVADELTPVVAGRIYCAVILVCQQAFDLRRAHEWTAALSEWCTAQPDIVPFRGQCLVHRSEVLQWHGDWAGAVEEALAARDRLSDPTNQPAIGMAFYQLGELYRLRGDFVEAETAFREASRHGRAPQPGLSCLRFMQGDLDAATAALRRVLGEPADRVTRARVLCACVDIMLVAGQDDLAENAEAELASIARRMGAPLLRAMATYAAGLVALHRRDSQAALRHAQQASAVWADLEAPYEQARSRLLGAIACRDLGDHDSAQLEADAARQTFLRLGARPDLRHLDALFPDRGPTAASPLTPRQLEVLSLVAAGHPNRQIAQRLHISEHTVRRHLQNIFTELGVSSRAAATSYAYQHGLFDRR